MSLQPFTLFSFNISACGFVLVGVGSALANAVRSKLEDGNIRAAVRIICSDEKPAENNDATLLALRQRHPSVAADRTASPDPATFAAVRVTKADVCAEIGRAHV